jgi:cytochrome aa3-600 menaquinol oxidase subunit 1
VILALGFAALVYNIYWSARYADRKISNDPWDARTLEWHTASPVQHYNFAKVPEVKSFDAYWYMKKNREGLTLKDSEIEKIHMPSNSGIPFYMCVVFGIVGFFLVFEWHILAAIATLGIIAGLVMRSFENTDGYYVPVEEVKETERAWRGEE